MVRTAGVFLIHAGVTLRCLIRLPRMEHPAWVVVLLALNGLLLILEAWVARRANTSPPCPPPLRGEGEVAPPSLVEKGVGGLGRLIYLLLQAAIITGLLFNRQVQDFFALCSSRSA